MLRQSASSIEFAFIIAKLSISAIVLATGAALIARETTTPLWDPPSGESHRT